MLVSRVLLCSHVTALEIASNFAPLGPVGIIELLPSATIFVSVGNPLVVDYAILDGTLVVTIPADAMEGETFTVLGELCNLLCPPADLQREHMKASFQESKLGSNQKMHVELRLVRINMFSLVRRANI